jgi:hypothetical protein
MDAQEALAQIRGLAAAGRYILKSHARDRMRERGAQPGDVRQALIDAAKCVWQPDRYNWRVTGPDLEGDDLTLAVEIEENVIVVTVF